MKLIEGNNLTGIAQNSFSNPYIYTYTNSKDKKFVSKLYLYAFYPTSTYVKVKIKDTFIMNDFAILSAFGFYFPIYINETFNINDRIEFQLVNSSKATFDFHFLIYYDR
jgi:hypothetical protein